MQKRRLAGLLQSPLTDSNRGPPLYEEGPWGQVGFVGIVQSWRAGWWGGGGGWGPLSFASSTGGQGWIGVSLRWRISLRAVRRPGGRWRLWERRVVRG